MKIKKINLRNFKRFTDFTINNIPASVKLVLVVGPNGSGKTSLFEAFYLWFKQHGGFGYNQDKQFYLKGDVSSDWHKLVSIEFHDNKNESRENIKGKFYFRTAYRNQSDFTINTLQKQQDPTTTNKISFLMQNDETVSENYQRLISHTLSGVYDKENETKTVLQLRNELIGKIQKSVNNVFEDLSLCSIGKPLSNGSFYFEKGSSKDFHYKNLSGGEKSAFDIILDLIIKSAYYPEAIFCIDEPEAHMHTHLQSLLLEEIFSLIPDNSQLWLSTHSIGMLKKAKEIEENEPGSVAFINFDELDFDNHVKIEPSRIDKALWLKFLELALDNFSTLIAPAKIIFCEGNQQGRKYKDFDAQVYSRIFEKKYHDVSFISIGSCTEIENKDNPSMLIVQRLLPNSTFHKLVDRDDKNTQEIDELNASGIKVLAKRHIESYLLDDEIISKLCNSVGKDELIQTCIDAKKQKIIESIERNNATDDIKSASGEIYNELKRILELTQCGNTTAAFLRDTLTPLVTKETQIYKDLHKT